MNPRLIIKNIGPINNADIEINRINFFIGMQGSGKSTMAKLISFCTWAEKKVLTEYFDETDTHIDSLFNKLISFHKLEGYFNQDSMFRYESSNIIMEYHYSSDRPNKIKSINFLDYKRIQVAYIPAERNIVSAIPNWFNITLNDNNIRSYLSDWESARKTSSKEKPLQILNMNAMYYYNSTENRDVLVIRNQKELDMTNSASGFQSIIPLLSIVNYYTHWIFNNEKKKSIEDLQRVTELQKKANKEYFTKNYPDITYNEAMKKVTTQAYSTTTTTPPPYTSEYLKKLTEASNKTRSLFEPQSTSLIIEEPEQNLFPETQRYLIYSLLSTIQATPEREHSLTITTHSPYVLFALNNCLLGGRVGKYLTDEEVQHLASLQSWIDPSLVSVWQIDEKGELADIKNPKTGTIGKQYFNDVMNSVMDEYYQLIKHLGKDEK